MLIRFFKLLCFIPENAGTFANKESRSESLGLKKKIEIEFFILSVSFKLLIFEWCC